MKLSNFKKHAGPVIMRRAEEYLAEGRVHLQDKAEGEYSYIVHGTRDYNTYGHKRQGGRQGAGEGRSV